MISSGRPGTKRVSEAYLLRMSSNEVEGNLQVRVISYERSYYLLFTSVRESLAHRDEALEGSRATEDRLDCLRPNGSLMAQERERLS